MHPETGLVFTVAEVDMLDPKPVQGWKYWARVDLVEALDVLHSRQVSAYRALGSPSGQLVGHGLLPFAVAREEPDGVSLGGESRATGSPAPEPAPTITMTGRSVPAMLDPGIAEDARP